MLTFQLKSCLQHTVNLIRQQRLSGRLGRSLGLIGLFLALIAGYVLSGMPVTLVINHQTYQLRTHRSAVEGILSEFGLVLAAEDIVEPPAAGRVARHQVITVKLARPVLIEADGRTVQLLTHQQTVAEVLAEAGIRTNTHDELLVNGVAVPGDSRLPAVSNVPPLEQKLNAASILLTRRTPAGAVSLTRPTPVQLILHRAVPVTLNDGGLSSTFHTNRPTVGEALLAQGLTLYLGDKVMPGLGTQLTPGMRIYIQRSLSVAITVDGRTIKTRTRRPTAGEVLAQEGIALMGQDFSRPPADTPITANDTIQVVRVRERLEIEQELIPFETKWLPDEEMPLDQQEVRQPGNTGVIKTRTRVRYENGQELTRELEDEWLDQEPSDRLIAYGTQITIRTVETEAGPLEYWRKISMLATPYSAATSGKDPDHPRYGITRSGLQAGYGIVAVDPKVIPLMTELYIPGYGQGLAGDTGGLIIGKHIDLGFDVGQPLPDLYEWRDVYVLTPVPPADKIRYVLPNWPQR